MFIKISSLKEGHNHLSYNGKIKEISLESPFINNYILEIDLEKNHNQMILNAHIDLEAKFECDRCSEMFNKRISTDFEQIYFIGVEKSNNVIDDMNLTYLSSDESKIDISQEIFDYSNLSIPMKKLCKEDCKGLCSTCGANLNYEECKCNKEIIDERWLPLLELKKKYNIP